MGDPLHNIRDCRSGKKDGSTLACRTAGNIRPISIDREFVTSAKKIANFNEFSQIKKIVTTTTEEFDAFHGFMLIKI